MAGEKGSNHHPHGDLGQKLVAGERLSSSDHQVYHFASGENF
jgi:hypothetical protein